MDAALRRPVAALFLFGAAVLPARADTTFFTLTASWQKIASAGQGVDVQNNNGAGYAVLSTSVGGPPSGSSGQALGPGEHRLYALSADLYALGTAPVSVTTGLAGAAGSSGIDYSVNPATVPAAGLVLLSTVPANAGRVFVEVQNQSVGTQQLVRDDGSGGNQTSIMLGPAAAAGQQGGGWSSSTFKGRIRVYGASGAQVSAYQD